MQLLGMEVNQLGSADRTQVSPLMPGLNAICGRRGSGKSSLVAWLRGMLGTHQAYSNKLNQVETAAGRVDVKVADFDYQFERNERHGKTDSKRITRHTSSAWNGQHPHHAAPTHEALSTLQREAFDRLSAIPSDSQAVYRLWDVARELNLDQTAPSRLSEERASLVAREQELLGQLHLLDDLKSTREGLLARKRQLESELDRARRNSITRHYLPGNDEHHRLQDRLAALEKDIHKLRDEVAELDAEILKAREGYTSHALASADERTYRERLLSLDAQLARWRNTLSEIRANRERLEAAATDAHLEGQLGEQFSPINQATPRLSLRSLEAQLVEARRHFDALLAGVDRYRTEFDDARNELPQTLRLMQRELNEVCQQLSRHESLTTTRAMKDQILQLTRCESEMRLAIERLIAERGELLRAIATACHLSVDQVTVAYSDSCRCSDHPHLDSWLSAISTTSNDPARQLVGVGHPREVNPDRLAVLEAQRQHAMSNLELAERDHRDTDARLRRLGIAPLSTSPEDRLQSELLRELDLITDELHRLETRDRLRVELSDVRRKLQAMPADVEDMHSLRGRYARHLSALTGVHSASAHNSRYASHANRLEHSLPTSNLHLSAVERDAYLRNGNLTNGQASAKLDPTLVSPKMDEVALRLAIAEVLASKGHHVPMILDETLDGLTPPQRIAAVRYLASQANASRLQVLAMTDDKDLVDAVRAVRGHVVSIVVSRALQAAHEPVDYDVNRQLTAFANDFESSKWSEPEWTPPAIRTEKTKRWVLTERSDIDDVPSIQTPTAVRLRALGIERVADLLDADANWVAEQARLPGVHAELVRAWQNECRLLCAMPQLRPFDARVLAGAGVRDHHQLNEMEPSRLLERVENFLATDRGRQIMRSGNNYELSRLTAWLASAKRNAHHREDDAPTLGIDPERMRARRTPVHRTDAAHTATPTYHIIEREDTDAPAASAHDADRADRRRPRRERPQRAERDNRSQRKAPRDTNVNANGLRFYLELTSDVVDAPSIGNTMAGSLNNVGVYTVSDLLNANPENLAHNLGQPRVTSAIIRAWQEQARLVCRIPNLRGHDAQILVACGITSPEALCRIDPQTLLAQTTSFANSTQGQRVLRGSQAPDLAEIKEWISWAGQSRNLMAA